MHIGDSFGDISTFPHFWVNLHAQRIAAALLR
jgi:hypothetical protein